MAFFRSVRGRHIEGNICWAVKEVDAAALVMDDDPFTLDDIEPVFLSLMDDASSPAAFDPSASVDPLGGGRRVPEPIVTDDGPAT
jgi:hypothetical protein